MTTRIYLDYNATSPLHPKALEALREYGPLPLNASSIHAEGRKARSLLETARRSLAEAIGAFPAEVVFTSSGTESNNWVFSAFQNRKWYVSAIEHPSVLKAAAGATQLPVTPDGVVDMALAEDLLPREPGFLVSMMMANNETGVAQPVAEMAALVHARGGLLHCDAAQALGKLPVDVNLLGCDLLTLCAHKMGGPVGAAALVVKGNLALAPQAVGGGQEFNRRAGTESVAAIAAFAEAVRSIDLGHMQQLRGWLHKAEQRAEARGAVVLGGAVERLPNTSCIIMPHASAQTQLMRLDLEGVSVSAGSACTSGKTATSHVLAAMGVSAEDSERAIRVSGGWGTTQQEVEAFLRAWTVIADSYSRKKS